MQQTILETFQVNITSKTFNIEYNKKHYFLVMILLICLCLITGCKGKQNLYPTQCSDIEKNYTLYLSRANNSDYSKKLQESISKIANTQCLYAVLMLGDLKYLTRDFSSAQQLFKSALRIAPNNVYTAFKLARAYADDAKHDSAIIYFRYAAKLKVSNGIVIDKTEDFSKVVGNSSLDVKYGEIIFQNGRASFYNHMLLEASREFKYCISQNTRIPESYYFLGLIYLEIGYRKDACEYFQLSVKNGNKEAIAYVIKNCSQDTTIGN